MTQGGGCRWNIFIKTDGSVLDSFLNQGASLSVGMPFVTPCPNNTYVMGLQAIAGCGGFTSLSVGRISLMSLTVHETAACCLSSAVEHSSHGHALHKCAHTRQCLRSNSWKDKALLQADDRVFPRH